MPKVFSREMWLMCSTDVIKHFIFSVYAYKKEDFSYSIKCTKYNSYAKLLSQKKKRKSKLNEMYQLLCMVLPNYYSLSE